MNSKEQITTPQTIALLSSSIIAYSILSLPSTLSKTVHSPNLWISVLGGGAITFLSGLLMVALTKYFPHQTFFEFNKKIVGSFLGTGISILFILYVITFGSLEIRGLSEVTQFYLFETTPLPVIIIPMMWVGLYIIIAGLLPIARLCEILFPVTLAIFFIVLIMSLKIFDINNVRPFYNQDIQSLLRGSISVLPSYSGIEFFLIFYAFMKKPQKSKKALTLAIAFPTILYLSTCILVIGGLSVERAKTETYPTITLIQEYEYVGILFERFESFFLAVWVIQIFTTYVICHYAAALGLSQLFKTKMNTAIFITLPFVYILALVPESVLQLTRLGSLLGYSSFIFSCFIPIILLLLVFIRRKLRV